MPEEEEQQAPLPDLTTDEQGSVSPLVLAIDETVEAQRHLEQQLRHGFGVNNTDFRALLLVFRLGRRGRSARPGDLTRGLGTSSGAASQIIARLSTAGLLRQAPDPDDARTTVLALSDEAATRLGAATRALRQDLDGIIATITSAEEQRIVELLERVRETFEDHSRRGPAQVGAVPR